MEDDLAIGDMGIVDPLGQIIDVPDPTIENPEGVSADMLGPGGVAASMADVGLSSGAVAMSTDEGVAGGFQGDSQAVSMGADGLGILPPVPDAPEPEVPPAYSTEGSVAPVSFPTSASGQTSFSESPVVPEASPVSSLAPAVDTALGGMADPLPMLEPPAPQDPAFAGVSTAPDELLDLQMALTPPEPSQEGFTGASDAPISAPAPTSGLDSGGSHVGLSLAMAQAISADTWSGGHGASAGSVSRGRSGAQVHIQNLHLPAASSNEFIDQLLAGSHDLTNADLSGWKD